MSIPTLTKLGFCRNCNEWYELVEGTSWLPIHEKKRTGKKCHSSGCSPSGFKYLVKTNEEARSLAEFIRDDDGRCLNGHGGRSHSLDCGEGRNCNDERHRLARALAEYYLEYMQKQQEPPIFV